MLRSTRNSAPLVRERAGFTLIELIVVICVISVLASVALQRLTVYQELAERAMMELTLRNIKTGLQIRLAELIIANRQSEAAQLERGNPIQWLAEKPANFGGDYRAPGERGNWYYDTDRGDLVYVVNNGAFLETRAANGVKELRFRTRLLKGVVNFGGTTTETVTGITLEPVYPYQWPQPVSAGGLA